MSMTSITNTTPQRDRRPGFLRGLWWKVFGEPDTMTVAAREARREAKRELKRATSHGAALMGLARFVAVPLMLVFSLSALVTLGQAPLEENFALYQAGRPLDYVSLLGLFVTAAFVFAMDVAMLVAAIILRDVRTRGGVWREQLHLWAVMLAVGALEAFTFIKMVAGYEHPRTLVDWSLVIGRGVMAPIIAIFLSLASERPVSHRDVQHLLQVRSGEGLLGMLERVLEPDTAHGEQQQPDMAQLFSFFTLVNGDMGTTQAEREAWYREVMATMERMAPASARALAHEEVARVRRESAHEVAAAQDHVRQLTETAQRQIAQANDAATQRTLDAVLSLVATGKLPDWLVEQRPDLATFSLDMGSRHDSKRVSKVGGGLAMAGAPIREPSSRAERQRTFLLNQSIEPCAAPDGRRGVWLRASDVSALMAEGRALASETPQQLVKRLGEGATVGRNLVAPFEPVMRELAERHLLSETAAQWWQAQLHATPSATSSENASERDVTTTAAANVIPMRA